MDDMEKLRRQRPKKGGPAKETLGLHIPVVLAWQSEIGRLLKLVHNRLYTDDKMEVEEIHRKFSKIKNLGAVCKKAEKIMEEYPNFSADQAIHFVIYGTPF